MNTLKSITLLVIFIFTANLLTAQHFSQQTSIVIQDVYDGSIDWGDYDNDGDLDILLTGLYPSSYYRYISYIYTNNGNNTFTKLSSTSFLGVYRSDAKWGDYNNDGYLDVIITGRNDSIYNQYTKLYKNNGNSTFSEQTGIVFPQIISGALDWGDYDNDGDLDLVMSGTSYQADGAWIYKNNGNNTFSKVEGLDLHYAVYGSVEWGDYDNDGDLDILQTGHFGQQQPLAKIYRNEGNDVFIEQKCIHLTNVTYSNAIWGDINNDGLLDILLTGDARGSIGATTNLYLNNGNNSFTKLSNTGLIALKNSCCDMGDFDNDGYQDIIISGIDNSNTPFTKVYKNNKNNTFTELISDTLIGVYDGYTKWGDYDNDGDLDILLTGKKNYGKITVIYKNNSSILNIKPSAPTNLASSGKRDKIVLKWDPSTDDSTSTEALTYNISIGNINNLINIKAPQSLMNNGFHQVARFGKIQDTCYSLLALGKLVFGDTFYWKVQSIDNSKLASDFSTTVISTVPLLVRAIGDTVKKINDTVPLLAIHNSNLPVSYSWSPSNTLSNPNIASPLAFPTESTTYYVTITSGTSTETDSVSVVVTPFEDANTTGILNMLHSRIAYGDFDNDNDLDILITGTHYYIPSSGTYVTAIFKNNGNNSFTNLGISNLISTANDYLDWVDLNNDGLLDIIINGGMGSGNSTCKIYKNNGNNTFTEIINHGLPNSYDGSFDAGDYDNDGDMDIVFAAKNSSGTAFTKIYRNNGNFSFSAQNIPLAGIAAKKIQWGDFDNNGTLDLLYGGNMDIRLYSNNGNNTFTNQNTTLFPHMVTTEVSWGDFNNDGYLDIFIMGNNPGQVAKIYLNNGNGTFREQIENCLSWGHNSDLGDYNNDGLLDLIITASATNTNAVYKNLGNGILKLDKCVFPTASSDEGDIFGDFNNDGKLDFLINGTTTGSRFNMVSTIYHNNSPDTNIAPSTPTGLKANSIGNYLHLTWDKAIDTITPNTPITYNVNIGTSYNGRDVKRTPSDSITGYLRKPMIAKIQDTNYYFRVPSSLQDTTFYWSVQSVDNAFKGSSIPQSSTMKYYSTSANISFAQLPNSCEGKKVISVKLINYGLSVIDSVSIEWESNGINQPIYKWFGSLSPNDSIDIDIDSAFYVSNGVIYNYKANLLKVNGDSNFSVINDTTYLSNQSYYSNPVINLGADTIYCWDEHIILDAGSGLSHYAWNTGDTTQIIELDSNIFNLGANQYSVTVTDSMQCYNSDTINIIIDPCTSIQASLLSQESMSIMPNPNNGKFNIILNNLSSHYYSLDIINILGERIYYKNINTNSLNIMKINIDISSFAKGLYSIKLYSEKNTIVKTIILK